MAVSGCPGQWLVVSFEFIVREQKDGSGKETNVQCTVVGTTAVCADGETTSGIISCAAARAFLSGMNLEGFTGDVTSPQRLPVLLVLWHRVDRKGGV